MITPLTFIEITQRPTEVFPLRGSVFLINGVTEGEINSGWKSLTDKATLVFPKNSYVSQDGRKISWLQKNIIGETETPILLRGDKVKIVLGYRFKDEKKEWKTEVNTEFEGYISKITPSQNIEIECEDAIYLFKQTQLKNKSYQKQSVQQVMKDVISQVNAINGTSITLADTIDTVTNVGNLTTENETAAQLLERLRDDYSVESFFRNGQLYCSGLVYYQKNAKSHSFALQKNIFENDFEVVREEDQRIGVKAISVSKTELTSRRKDGTFKKKKSRLEVTVGATDGEIRTLHFWDAKNIEELKAKANTALKRLNYTGLKGKFTTLALPFVTHGDNITIDGGVLPDFNGIYKCKSTQTTFGMGGLFREIELDIRVDSLNIDL